jgi:hypothetical protein
VRRLIFAGRHYARNQCDFDPPDLREVKFGLCNSPCAFKRNKIAGGAGDLASQSFNALDSFGIRG